MAKRGPRSGSVNKTQAVQEHYAKHPNASPLEVQTALHELGIDVPRSFISTTKWHMKKKGIAPAPVAEPASSSNSDSLNKSTEIRNLITARPDLRNKDVLEELQARGISVTPTLVSNVRKRLAAAPKEEPVAKKRTLRGRKPGRPPASASVAAAPVKAAPSVGISYESILQAKVLVDSLGGDINLARTALDALAKIRAT